MKKILGLDLGTNSIGWAVVNGEMNGEELQLNRIEAAGSRIIPMDAGVLGDFERGNSVSQTAARTFQRGVRRLIERKKLRRERLHKVLNEMNFLPSHYAACIDKHGKFIDGVEVKLPWVSNEIGKYDFLFQQSFEAMIVDFPGHLKVPYDWTIYYLRKKALTSAISKEELAWILLNFNQKRGYNQLRDEIEENNPDKKEEYYELKVVEVVDSGDKKGKDVWYNVVLENGWVYRRTSNVPLDWVGKMKEFIVTTQLNPDRTEKLDKDGNVRRSLRMPKEDDWSLVKKKTESDLANSGKTVGCYIYDALIKDPTQKITGKLIQTIDRSNYKEELRMILEKQREFHAELNDRELYERCTRVLYPNNDAHRNNIGNADFTYLFLKDIIFYQRPLKSKKSLIADCPYEGFEYIDKKTKECCFAPLKCIVKSHPLYQEFRLWQFVQNMKIYEKEKSVGGKLYFDYDVTAEFLKSAEDYVALFGWLNDRKEVEQGILLSSYFKIKKLKNNSFAYRWNYVEDKKYPCNKTRNAILVKLKEEERSQLTRELEEKIWHLLYSVSTRVEIDEALKDKGRASGIYADLAKVFCIESIENLKSVKIEEKDYGAYSAKAIRKLLAVMRMGSSWSVDAIDVHTKGRIEKLITGEYDEKIKTRVREKSINLTHLESFSGLPLWLACYVVYDRHSEGKEICKWRTPKDIDMYLHGFKQHSLRNPIVEQVVTETLRTVRDIWKQVGVIDEIHVELGREMKNPADKRKRMTANIIENENTNLRIKAMLAEFADPQSGVEQVRAYSASQQEILKIYEEFALQNLEETDREYEFVTKIAKTPVPTKSEITRYKLWLEQKYKSPYTGKMIPLSRLFTSDYEIEHIIPQSRYFDDSLSNKVICEAEVNRKKDRQLAYEFIKMNPGLIVDLGSGNSVKIFSIDEYEVFVTKHYKNSRTKLKKLMMEDIPDGFIERQLNDSRYISKYVRGLLSNIVREELPNGEYEQESISKHLISCNGVITDRLKKDWGVIDQWNRIILPRFKRLDAISKYHFIAKNTEGHEIPSMPLELQKRFSKKRIDHRHHAMDAIVIACASRSHVNLLNNESAMSKNNANRYQLQRKLRRYESVAIIKNGVTQNKEVAREFLKPWANFPHDVYDVLRNMVVSIKQNLRIINKTTNYYEKMEDGKRVRVKQTKGDSWAIRKSMHKDTVFGEVNLRKIKMVSLNAAVGAPKMIVEKDLKRKVIELQDAGYDNKKMKKYFEDNKDIWRDLDLSRIEVYYYTKDTKDRHFATRKSLDVSFDRKKILEKVTDTGIQKILLSHLQNKLDEIAVGEDVGVLLQYWKGIAVELDKATEKRYDTLIKQVSELAFSPDGLDEMNKNITALNGGKFHHPIYKVREYEKADKFSVGVKGNKAEKYVEAAKGTNLFFAIYEREDKMRAYESIPLHVAIKRQKCGDQVALEQNDEGAKLLFVLSPNDLVYVPTKEEIESGWNGTIDRSRIYKFVSCTGNRGYFVPCNNAQVIEDKVEYTSLNKVEFTDDRLKVITVCYKIQIDRLGNLIINL